MMVKIYKLIVLSLSFIFSAQASGAVETGMPDRGKVAAAKVDTAKKVSPYAKIFEGKKTASSKGLMTLHRVEDRIYVELPLALLEKRMLLSSNIEMVSDPAWGYVGQKVSNYSQIIFSRTDSMALIRLVNRATLPIADETQHGMNTALNRSNIAPILIAISIIALSPDSTAIVFDASAFFLGGDKNVVNVNGSGASGMFSFSGDYKKEKSVIRDIKAYADNIAVVTDMSFGMKASIMGFSSANEYLSTVTVRTTISTLSDNPMKTRAADMRLGTNLTPLIKYGGNNQRTEVEYLSNRWRIEPSDPEAYRRGVIVGPVKPIVFYIDTLFAPSHRDAIKKGLEAWNRAFEEIGFRNVIQARPYPRNDPDFSAANTIRYNCVKFVMNDSRGVSKNILTDPRTGEILSVSMSFGKEFISALLRERILLTAAADVRVRGNKLPDELLCEGITAKIIRETGYCLGLNYNNAGSSSYPVDSLKSATFTAENGLSASALDDLLFNSVAQPGDVEKGVRIVTTDIGVYDRYAIKWLYSPLLDAENPEQERMQLNKWIEEKAGDPRYRFGAPQTNFMIAFDPRSLAGDMGDDIVKSTKYQIENLKYVAAHCAEWMDCDDTDETNKELFADFVLLRLIYLVADLHYSIGGMYVDEKYSTDLGQKFTYLPRVKQQEIFNYILDILSDVTWIDNKKLLLMSTPNANLSESIVASTFGMPFRRLVALNMSSYYSENPYTIEDMLNDMKDFVLKKVKTGEQMTQTNLIMLDMMVENFNAAAKTAIVNSKKGSSGSFSAAEEYGEYRTTEEFSGSLEHIMGELLKPYYDRSAPRKLKPVGGVSINTEVIDSEGYMPLQLQDISSYYDRDMGAFYYSALKDIRAALNKGAVKTRNENLRNHYNYKSLQIGRILDGE